LAALATAAIPGLDIVGVRLEHEGADYAFAHAKDATGRTWVIRIPRHPAAGAGQEAEVALLRALIGASTEGGLPFEVPRPRGFALMDGGGRAMVYSQLPGVPLVMELLEPGPGLAASLGRAIASIHLLPTDLVADAGLPIYTPTQYRARLTGEVEEAARTGYVPIRLLERWKARLDEDAWWVFEPVLIHGDMAPEHLLEHAGRISAMMDFAGVQVSDPAEDLAPLLAAASEEAAASILEAYLRRREDLDDPHLEDRAAFLAEIAIIRWLLHGVRHEDEAIIDDARQMLDELDETVEAEERETSRLAKLEAERQAELEAAKRASDAAAREHQRTTGSLPVVTDEPATGTPAEGEEPGEIAALLAMDQADADETTVLAGAGPDETTVLSEPPERRPVTTNGIDLWGQGTHRPAPTWDQAVKALEEEAEQGGVPDLAVGPEEVSAAATPPPGLGEAAAAVPVADEAGEAADAADSAGDDDSDLDATRVAPGPLVEDLPAGASPAEDEAEAGAEDEAEAVAVEAADVADPVPAPDPPAADGVGDGQELPSDDDAPAAAEPTPPDGVPGIHETDTVRLDLYGAVAPPVAAAEPEPATQPRPAAGAVDEDLPDFLIDDAEAPRI
jgi:aminoglycoside phosphotransferase (APT) family kinase protein